MALKEQQYQISKEKDEGSGNEFGNEIVDYSRAPCLGADQRHVGSENKIAINYDASLSLFLGTKRLMCL